MRSTLIARFQIKKQLVHCIHVLFWFLIFCLLKVPVFAQLIDTALDPAVSLNDTVNRELGRMKGVNVKIFEPVLVYNKGKKIQAGFKDYYIYVVKAKNVLINNARLFTNDTVVYLAVTGFEPTIKELPQVIESRAIYLKGMIDRADSLKLLYYEQMLDSKVATDSMARLVRERSKYLLDEKSERRLDSIYTRYYNDAYYYNLYKNFLYYRKNKGGKYLADFFLSDYFNRRDLKFSIMASPYSLPKIVDGLPDLGNKKSSQVEPTNENTNEQVQESSFDNSTEQKPEKPKKVKKRNKDNNSEEPIINLPSPPVHNQEDNEKEDNDEIRNQ